MDQHSLLAGRTRDLIHSHPCYHNLYKIAPVSPKLSHYDRSGRARMVDVSNKNPTKREAEASAFVALKPAVLKALPKNPKGDPLEVPRLAGIEVANRGSDVVPSGH